MDSQQNQNNGQELLGVHCNLCGKKVEFLCGRCFDVGYCKPQHQKIDWASHRSKCVSVADKIKNHNKEKYGVRGQIFQFLSEGRYYEAAQASNRLLQKQKKFCQTSPSFPNELQYGASVVLLTRIWIYYKDFNKALDVLNAYLQTNIPFLRSTDNLMIPSDGFANNPQKKDLIEKKLNLISAVASVYHELVRNAMDILEILINHIEVIYGSNSLELSNIYFYCANYLNFLNQPNKAFACFLKSAKLRGAKCSTSYFNAGLICLELKNYSLALDVLLQSLNNLTQVQKTSHPEMQTQLYEALGITYKNLNNYTKTVLSLQRALCLRQKSKQKSPEHRLKYKNLQVLLATIKAEAQKIDSEIKMYALPKEKPITIKGIDINLNNYKNINGVDKLNLNEEEENKEWIESFNQFRKKMNVDSKIPQVPPVVKAKLFGKDRQEVVREDDLPSVTKSKDKVFAEEKIQISLELIEMFTSSQMDFLNELNRLISECREKSAIIDIFQNSNLYQTLSKEKLDLLYRLNPKLLRNTRQVSRKFNLEESFQEGSENFSKQYALAKRTSPKKKIITPRLNLQSIKKNF